MLQSYQIMHIAKQKNQAKYLSINKHEQVTQEKIGMAHGGPSFALRLKTHKVKFFHKRLNQEILK